MGFLNLFGGDSSSTTKNQTYDQKIGASENAVAQRIEAAEGATVTLSSDKVAQYAIDAASANLSATEEFLSNQIGSVLTLLNGVQSSAAANVAASQQIAGETISKGQQTTADQLGKLVIIAGGLMLGYAAIKAGYFK